MVCPAAKLGGKSYSCVTVGSEIVVVFGGVVACVIGRGAPPLWTLVSPPGKPSFCAASPPE